MIFKITSLFKRTVSILALVLAGISSYAQGTYTVKLRLVDAKTAEPVSFATASLTVKGEETAARYVLTDAEGAASLSKVKKGTYVLKAELMGYKSHEQEIAVEKNIDLGEIKMNEDVEVLDAASVSAVGNPIVVKKDTIEYTASSFKTSDNDMLEELLKKLPGVEVEADGSITANGETITKIMIDGKSFFLDDPQLASKNIPAKLIEKVKVVEKKSDQAIFTGIDDGEEEHIIDLSMKPGMLDGWFGNLMGGGGHDVPNSSEAVNDPRFQGAAMLGRFTDKSQISIILNGNNTNNRGFNDMAGSMMQEMRMGGMGRGMGGWGRGNGIATSWMGGLNGAFDFFDGDMELAGNYLYNGSVRNVIEDSYKVDTRPDKSRLITDQYGTSRNQSQGHRFGMRLEHDFSENTSIIFEPQFNFGKGGFNEFSRFQTDTERDTYRDTTNTGYSSNLGDNENWSASGFFLFRQRLGKPGRTISANVRYRFNNNELDGFNQSLTSVKNEETHEWTDDIINQRFAQRSRRTSLNGRIVYTEPLAEHLFLEANYQYDWNRNISRKDTYNSPTNLLDEDGMLEYKPEGEKKDARYSNSILNRTISQTGGISFSYQKKGVRVQLGASVNPSDIYNETTGHDPYRNKVLNWSPNAMFNYEFNDNTHIRFFYFGRSAQPSTSQLLPVPDNSNPLSISLGNPNLDPYFSHSLRGMFGYTNKETFTSVHARFGASLVEDGITNARWYDEAGVQYSMPVNGPGSGSVDGRIMVNSPLGETGLSVFSMTNARYNQSTAYVGESELDSDRYYNAEDASFNYALFNHDFPELLENGTLVTNDTKTVNFTQRLRLTYRNDFVELTLGGRTRMNKSWYTMNDTNLDATWSNQVEGSMNWTVPGGINIIADVDYNWYNGYTTPQEDEVIMNAEITKLLFNNKCTLALKAYDILGQSKNLSVSDNANTHQEVINNTLGRYIILSLTYRFGNFGGMGGHGGHRGGPMGHRR